MSVEETDFNSDEVLVLREQNATLHRKLEETVRQNNILQGANRGSGVAGVVTPGPGDFRDKGSGVSMLSPHVAGTCIIGY